MLRWESILRLLPVLFNIVTGYCAWVPASYDSVEVVVVSIRIIRWIVEFYLVGATPLSQEVKVEEFKELFLRQWQLMGKEPVNVDYGSRDFRSLLLQTPFKPSHLKMGVSQNSNKFFVAKAADWKFFMGQIRLKFPVCDVKFTKVQEVAIETLGERFSVLPWNAKPGWLNGHGFSVEKRKKIPSMGVPWWRELMSDGVRVFAHAVDEDGLKSFYDL